MKRVLITGAAGFMGSHVFIHFLHNTDWELVLLDSFQHKGMASRIRQQLDVSHPEYWNRVKVIPHDLRIPIDSVMKQQIGHIDYIVNIASESHVDRSIEEPRSFIDNNVQLILTMLEYAREVKPEKFLHISTDEVYGPAPEGHNHKEGEPHKPSNPYSASKSAQEAIIYAYRRTYDLRVAISNTMNIIGELQDTEKFVPMVIKKVLANETMAIHASADGKIGSRFYLHARNQADGLMFLLKNIPFPTYSEESELPRFNIVGEREMDNLEMAQLIAKYIGKPLKYELVDFHSSRPGHDLRYALDGTKMAELGWVAPLSLEDSLKNTVEWTLTHQEWL